MKLKGVCITFKKVSKWADWTNRRTNGWMYIGKGEGGKIYVTRPATLVFVRSSQFLLLQKVNDYFEPNLIWESVTCKVGCGTYYMIPIRIIYRQSPMFLPITKSLFIGHDATKIRVALTKWTHTEPERGFEPGSAGYKAPALPFELSFHWQILRLAHPEHLFDSPNKNPPKKSLWHISFLVLLKL